VYVHVLAWLVPFCMGCAMVHLEMYNPTNINTGHCFINPYPANCWRVEGVACERGAQCLVWSMITVLPYLLYFQVVLVSSILTYRTIRQVERCAQRWSYQSTRMRFVAAGAEAASTDSPGGLGRGDNRGVNDSAVEMEEERAVDPIHEAAESSVRNNNNPHGSSSSTNCNHQHLHLLDRRKSLYRWMTSQQEQTAAAVTSSSPQLFYASSSSFNLNSTAMSPATARNTRQALIQAVLYICSFAVTYLAYGVMSFASLFYDGVQANRRLYFFWVVLVKLTLPSAGIWNVCIFARPRLASLRHPLATRSAPLRLLIFPTKDNDVPFGRVSGSTSNSTSIHISSNLKNLQQQQHSSRWNRFRLLHRSAPRTSVPGSPPVNGVAVSPLRHPPRQNHHNDADHNDHDSSNLNFTPELYVSSSSSSSSSSVRDDEGDEEEQFEEEEEMPTDHDVGDGGGDAAALQVRNRPDSKRNTTKVIPAEDKISSNVPSVSCVVAATEGDDHNPDSVKNHDDDDDDDDVDADGPQSATR
jgi:hypothetical protein